MASSDYEGNEQPILLPLDPSRSPGPMFGFGVEFVVPGEADSL